MTAVSIPNEDLVFIARSPGRYDITHHQQFAGQIVRERGQWKVTLLRHATMAVETMAEARQFALLNLC